ncbi:MAG: hypothetical protein DWH80_09230 [Planctomycetota bacterium]|nr:MAG: hypothetical protein DWH80_09230 [Planctomycetota bacterium]
MPTPRNSLERACVGIQCSGSSLATTRQTLGRTIPINAVKATNCRSRGSNVMLMCCVRQILFSMVVVCGTFLFVPHSSSAQTNSAQSVPVAAALKKAAELGIVVGIDKQGNVVSIDTASNRSWVDDQQMLQILVFPTLTSLTLEGPSITDKLAATIARCTHLTSLAMRNTLIGDDGIKRFSVLKSLKAIDLRVSPLVTDRSTETLAAMPQLRAVRLNSCNVTDVGVQKLASLPDLRELDVRGCRGVTSVGIGMLNGHKTLKTLKIGGPAVDDAMLAIVGRMKTISTLSLDNCAMTDAGIAKLTTIPLTDLTIFQNVKVSDEGLAVLSHFHGLTSLTLRDVSLTGTCLHNLQHPEKIKSLNLAQSRLTDSTISLLKIFTGVENLNLSETKISDAAIDVLVQLTSLKELVLSQTGISQEGATRIRKALPECMVELN